MNIFTTIVKVIVLLSVYHGYITHAQTKINAERTEKMVADFIENYTFYSSLKDENDEEFNTVFISNFKSLFSNKAIVYNDLTPQIKSGETGLISVNTYIQEIKTTFPNSFDFVNTTVTNISEPTEVGKELYRIRVTANKTIKGINNNNKFEDIFIDNLVFTITFNANYKNAQITSIRPFSTNIKPTKKRSSWLIERNIISPKSQRVYLELTSATSMPFMTTLTVNEQFYENLANLKTPYLKSYDQKLGLNATYFFNEKWSLGTGLQMAYHRAHTQSNEENGRAENAPDTHSATVNVSPDYMVNIQNFSEKYHLFYLNVPMTVNFLTYNYNSHNTRTWRFYAKVGLNMGIPFHKLDYVAYETVVNKYRIGTYTIDQDGETITFTNTIEAIATPANESEEIINALYNLYGNQSQNESLNNTIKMEQIYNSAEAIADDGTQEWNKAAILWSTLTELGFVYYPQRQGRMGIYMGTYFEYTLNSLFQNAYNNTTQHLFGERADNGYYDSGNEASFNNPAYNYDNYKPTIIANNSFKKYNLGINVGIIWQLWSKREMLNTK